MYYYIVDTATVTKHEFERVQKDLYSAIAEYKINGEIVRVTGIRTIKQLVETAFFHQAKTIVAVGTDQTLNEIVDMVGDRPMIIGYIPLIKTQLAEVFGLENITSACKSLGLRRIAEIDLGVITTLQPDNLTREVTQNHFISQVAFGCNVIPRQKGFWGLSFLQKIANLPVFELNFMVDHQFKGVVEITCGLVVNCRKPYNSNVGHPTNGELSLVLIPKLTRSQTFRFRSAILNNEWEQIPGVSIIQFETLEITKPIGVNILAEDKIITKTPVRMEIQPKALKLIVSRSRKFE